VIRSAHGEGSALTISLVASVVIHGALLSSSFHRPEPRTSPTLQPVRVRLAPLSPVASAPTDTVVQPSPSALVAPRTKPAPTPTREPAGAASNERPDTPDSARNVELPTAKPLSRPEHSAQKVESPAAEPESHPKHSPPNVEHAAAPPEPHAEIADVESERSVELAAVASPDAAPLVRDQARARYQDVLAAWLERHREYPFNLRRRGVEGAGVLRLEIGRSGRVESAAMIRPIEDQRLDELAMKMVGRADPFPPMPDELAGGTFACEIDIRFELGE